MRLLSPGRSGALEEGNGDGLLISISRSNFFNFDENAIRSGFEFGVDGVETYKRLFCISKTKDCLALSNILALQNA